MANAYLHGVKLPVITWVPETSGITMADDLCACMLSEGKHRASLHLENPIEVDVEFGFDECEDPLTRPLVEEFEKRIGDWDHFFTKRTVTCIRVVYIHPTFARKYTSLEIKGIVEKRTK